jgi:Pectate lyase superfamily protein
MTLRALIRVFLILTLSSCRIVATGSGQEGGKIVNVREFGARGNGVADDTAAVQSAINAAKAGETIYFPSGIYNVSNFVVKNRSGLSFVGEGQKSVIKQKAGAARIATVEASRDIVISNLAFDANGIVSYGGMVFYAVTGVRIENNTFIDSAPKPIGRTDRYSFVFARGSVPSRDIKILNNVIEDLQLEVDHSQRVVIERNSVKRAVATAGIGIFTIGDGAIAEDYQITNNIVIDPVGAGFSVGIDPPTDSHCVFRRITIADNQVIRTKTAGYGVRLGTPNNSIKTTGNVFEDIVIKNNRLRSEASAPQPSQMIFANTTAKAGIVFERLIVTGNTIENERPNNNYAIDLRRVRNSIVTDNSVKGVASGISLTGDLLANQVRNNVVEASEVAYRLEDSLGGNRAANNRIVGKPKQGWLLSNMKATDTVQQQE